MSNETMKDGERAALLPCPFCGSEAQMIHGDGPFGGRVQIDCVNCRNATWWWEEAIAVRSWNTRAASPQSSEKGKNWIERWHGSEPFRGWSIFAGRECVAYLGGDESESMCDAVTAIVQAHNRAAAPQAALSDEQKEAWYVEWPGEAEQTWHHVFINEADALQCAANHDGAIVTHLLATTPTERMSDAARDAKDAERYRYLRSRPMSVEPDRIDVVYWSALDESANEGEALRGDALDDAIDAARKAEIERSGGEAC